MIRKFQRQDLEAAVKIWLAANKEAHDFIDPCYWEGYKDAVKEMFLQAEIYVFETEDMMEEIFDETGGILGFIGLDKDYVEGIFVRGDVRSQSIGKQSDLHSSMQTTLSPASFSFLQVLPEVRLLSLPHV